MRAAQPGAHLKFTLNEPADRGNANHGQAADPYGCDKRRCCRPARRQRPSPNGDDNASAPATIVSRRHDADAQRPSVASAATATTSVLIFTAPGTAPQSTGAANQRHGAAAPRPGTRRGASVTVRTSNSTSRC